MLPDFIACDLSLLGIRLNHCGGHFCNSVFDRHSIGKLAGKLVELLKWVQGKACQTMPMIVTTKHIHP